MVDDSGRQMGCCRPQGCKGVGRQQVAEQGGSLAAWPLPLLCFAPSLPSRGALALARSPAHHPPALPCPALPTNGYVTFSPAAQDKTTRRFFWLLFFSFFLPLLSLLVPADALQPARRLTRRSHFPGLHALSAACLGIVSCSP